MRRTYAMKDGRERYFFRPLVSIVKEDYEAAIEQGFSDKKIAELVNMEAAYAIDWLDLIGGLEHFKACESDGR